MKKKIQKRNHSGFEDDYEFKSAKKSRPVKDKSNKKRLSIYDDYDDDEDDFMLNEKFGNKRK